jgi:hypothetical protein
MSTQLLEGAGAEGEGAAGGQQGEPPAMLGDDGNFNPDWLGHGELAPHKAQLAKFKTPTALAQSYIHLEKSKGVPKLAENATDEDKAAYNDKLAVYRESIGVPTEAAGYALEAPEDLPEGVELPDGAIERYQDIFHKHGVTPDQAKGIMADHLASLGEDVESAKAAAFEQNQAAVGKLKEEWGFEFKAKLGVAQETFDTLATKAGLDPEATENAAYLQDPNFAKLMAHVGSKMMGESDFQKPGAHVANNSSKEESLKIMNDPKHADHEALNNPNDPRHHEVMDKVALGLKN